MTDAQGAGAAAEGQEATGQRSIDTRSGGAGGSMPKAPDLSPMLAETGERVQAVLDATDRAAEEILDNAKAEAQRYVRETHSRAERLTKERLDRISSLTEELLSQTSSIQKQAQTLSEVLDRSVARLAEDLGIDEERPGGTAGVAAPAPSSMGEEEIGGTTEEPLAGELSAEKPARSGRLFGRRKRSDSGQPSDGARLVALQMKVAGEDDEAIAQRLKDEFGIGDPAPILELIDSEEGVRS